MRKVVIIFILFLSLFNSTSAQQKDTVTEENELEVYEFPIFDILPALDDPECFRWLVYSNGAVDWSNPESLMSGMLLYPVCGELPYIEKPYNESYYIFSFKDSLTIETYDPVTKKLAHPISYKIEDNEYPNIGFLIYASDSMVIELFPSSVYQNYYGTSTRYRIPMDVAGNNVWIASGVDNTVNCAQFRNNNLLVDYSTGIMDFVVKNKVYTQFQIFTFGKKLVVQTYDRLKDEVIKTQEFEYAKKANDPLTLLVQFSNFSAEFSAYDSHNIARYKYFVVKCID